MKIKPHSNLNFVYVMVRSKVTSLYLQNPRKKLILGFKMILNTSPISLVVSITSGKYSATFSMSLQLLTPSELGDRSIFVSEVRVKSGELKEFQYRFRWCYKGKFDKNPAVSELDTPLR